MRSTCVHGNPGSNVNPHCNSPTGRHADIHTRPVAYPNSDCGCYTRSPSIGNSNPARANLTACFDSSRYTCANPVRSSANSHTHG